MANIGYLGFGNMAEAVAQGLKQTGTTHHFYATAAHYDALVPRARNVNVTPLPANEALLDAVDVVIVAIKPHLVPDVLQPLASRLAGKVVISFAAGLTTQDYRAFLPESTHVLVTMPNLPMAVGEGVLIVDDAYDLTEDEFQFVEELFSPIAAVVPLPSTQMRVAGTLSGCGPAFADLFLEALADAGVKYGLSRAAAYRIASQTLKGAAALQLATGLHPGVLKDRVTSPGGTTIRGIAALEEKGFRHSVIAAVDAIEGRNVKK